ncbi:hypothetical protein ACWEFJ_26395 [Actinosynnema sp. NPDC004786]
MRPPLTLARPSIPPARALPVVGAAPPKPAKAAERPASRSAPVLGEPLTALPPTASAGGHGGVVQRSTAPTPPVARVQRGTGIGEPMSELPATASPVRARPPKTPDRKAPGGKAPDRNAPKAPDRNAPDGKARDGKAQVAPTAPAGRPTLDRPVPRVRAKAPEAGPSVQRLPVVAVTRLPAGQATAPPAPTRPVPEPRPLPLIAERPLTTNTGLPEPLPHKAARPVVRPRWSGTPNPTPPRPTGAPGRTTTPPAPRVHVQRHTGGPGHTAPAVVRPTPPRPLDHPPKLPPAAHPHPSGTPVEPRRDRTSTAPADAPRPTPGNVPAKWPATTTVQRTPSTTRTTPAGADTSTAERGDDNKPLPPLDLDDLARRLLDPVGRLLRAELREGRERNGRLHDRRR